MDTPNEHSRENIDSYIGEYLDRIAQNLLALRGRMSQMDLAKRAGVSRTTIQRMEKGEDFLISNFFRIAATFGKSPIDLCQTEDERVSEKVRLESWRLKLKEELKAEILAELKVRE